MILGVSAKLRTTFNLLEFCMYYLQQFLLFTHSRCPDLYRRLSLFSDLSRDLHALRCTCVTVRPQFISVSSLNEISENCVMTKSCCNAKVMCEFKYLTNIKWACFPPRYWQLALVKAACRCNCARSSKGVSGSDSGAEFLVIKVVDSGRCWGKERPSLVLRIANESVNRAYYTINSLLRDTTNNFNVIN